MNLQGNSDLGKQPECAVKMGGSHTAQIHMRLAEKPLKQDRSGHHSCVVDTCAQC